VIDYKTGKPAKAKKMISPPKKEDDPGGDYWRQIIFYKILLDNDPKNKWIAQTGSVFLIEPDTDGSFYKHKIVFNPEEIRFVENQLSEVHQKIKNHEFNKGCGEPTCTWCNFVRNRNTLLQFSRSEEIKDNL